MAVCPAKFSDVTPQDLQYFWKPVIPFGKVTLIQGDTGIGKTSLILKILADVSNGIYPPTLYQGKLQPPKDGEPLRFYYVTAENDMSDTIVPQFIRYNGNMDYACFQDENKGHFALSGEEIEECVRVTGARIIFIDPWQQFVDGISPGDNTAIRKLICDVQSAAQKTNTAVIIAGNFSKSTQSEIYKGLGGSELNNTLRCVLTIRPDPEGDPSVRVLHFTKMSLPDRENTPIIIRRNDDGDLSFETDAQDFFQLEDEVPSVFLENALKNGPMDSKTIMSLATARGFGTGQIYRARQKLGVNIEKQSDKSSQWSLPT